MNEQTARQFAIEAHGDQRYGDVPYAHHLYAVRQVLADFGHHGGPLAVAAWLHDVLEDTATTDEEIVEHFGSHVWALVWAVTGRGATRADRVADVYQKIKEMGEPAVTLKLAERVANVEACRYTRCDLIRMYREEQPGFCAALRELGGDASLWARLDRALGPVERPRYLP